MAVASVSGFFRSPSSVLMAVVVGLCGMAEATISAVVAALGSVPTVMTMGRTVDGLSFDSAVSIS